MSVTEYSDVFVVVNGPEDGTEFPISRAPFGMGQDSSCAVNIRLDTSVRKIHAHVSVVADGYRIRRADAAPVYVNGKRAGALRSRVVRRGGIVQIGRTQLALECAPDGLARRSRGIDIESDVMWALREGSLGAVKAGRFIAGFLTRMFGRLLGSWVAIGGLFVLLYLFWPLFRAYVNYYALYGFYSVRNVLPF